MAPYRHRRRDPPGRRVERAAANHANHVNHAPLEDGSQFSDNDTTKAVAGSTASHRSSSTHPAQLNDNTPQAAAAGDHGALPALLEDRLVQHQQNMRSLWVNPLIAQHTRQDRAGRARSPMRSLDAESGLPQHAIDDVYANFEGMLVMERYLAESPSVGYQIAVRQGNGDDTGAENAADISLEDGPLPDYILQAMTENPYFDWSVRRAEQ